MWSCIPVRAQMKSATRDEDPCTHVLYEGNINISLAHVFGARLCWHHKEDAPRAVYNYAFRY